MKIWSCLIHQSKFLQRCIVLSGITLGLLGCSGVRWQSASEVSAQIYASAQAKALSDCLKQSAASDASACQKQFAGSYDRYSKEQEKAKSSNPSAEPTQ
jgi:hypothetical protein